MPGTVLGAEMQRCIRYSPCPEGFTVWKGRQTCKQVIQSEKCHRQAFTKSGGSLGQGIGCVCVWREHGVVFPEEGALRGIVKNEQVFARQTRQEEQGKAFQSEETA